MHKFDGALEIGHYQNCVLLGWVDILLCWEYVG